MATLFVTGITTRFEDMRRFPLTGAPRPQLAPGLRVIFKGSYAIYYLPRDGEIVVVRVLHGSRDAAAIAGQEGFAI
jgi:toxin ParE1/3/4